MIVLLKRLKNHTIKTAFLYKKQIKWLSWAVNATSVLVLVCWIFSIPIKIGDNSYEQEPVFAGLVFIYGILNQLYRWLFNESEYSVVHALAEGYVSNFLAPVVVQLMEDGEKHPTVYIYKPERLSELYRNNTDRVKAKIRNQNFDVGEVNLAPKQARARDVMTVQKSKTKKIYFDFPNTLTSLVSYIDYKISSKENNSSEKAKELFARKLINVFFEKVDELLEKESIETNIKYCNKELKIDF